jgi:hypothetical protein
MSQTATSTSKLARYLDLQAQKLRVDLQAARLFIGTTDIGNVAENAVRKFLRSILPARYSVGVGEAIASNGTLPQRIEQTQQKDVLIYDPYGSAIFNWDDSEINLFPVESLYGVIEVKTSIRGQTDLLAAVDQTLEVKKLCQTHRSNDQSPFTAVFAFESKGLGDTLFDALKKRSPNERPDFVLILEPLPTDTQGGGHSFYFSHWHYHSRGGGSIDFVTADQTAQERISNPPDPDRLLTFGETGCALLWFYLFLIEQLDNMRLTRPNLWDYAESSKQRLGWRNNE